MGATYYIVIAILIIIGFIMKKKKIKDIKLFNFSIFNILIILYIITIIIIEFIIPIPTYYIKPKDEIFIEKIIEKEMRRANIEYDIRTLEVVNQFFGKYNQLYFCKYEVNGVEEARMFDFKRNILGSLKPSHDFSKSKVILKSEKDDGLNFRIIGDGFARFFISYGYSNNPDVFKNYGVNKYNVVNLNLESYYMIISRTDNLELLYLAIYAIILFIIIRIKSKKENKISTYRLVILSRKKINVLEVEYFIQE